MDVPCLVLHCGRKNFLFRSISFFAPAAARIHSHFHRREEFLLVQPMHAKAIRARGGVAITGKSQSHGRQAALELGPRGRGKISYQPTLASKAETESWEANGFRQGAISVFILFHLMAILCWTIPTDSPFMVGMRGLVGPYMQWAGLAQSWDTFAPNPKAVNSYIKAVAITQHGRMHVFAFPRMEQLVFSERYGKERYRKFAENLAVAANAAVWPDIARHVAGLYKNPADPPDKVVLVQFVADITPWAQNEDVQRPRPAVFYEDYVEREDPK